MYSSVIPNHFCLMFKPLIAYFEFELNSGETLRMLIRFSLCSKREEKQKGSFLTFQLSSVCCAHSSFLQYYMELEVEISRIGMFTVLSEFAEGVCDLWIICIEYRVAFLNKILKIY